MKMTKRVIALLLGLVLAFSLVLPVFAEDEPDPAMPVVTREPQNIRVKIKTDAIFTLSVEAHIPNGDEIGYQWTKVRPDGRSEIISYDAEITQDTRAPKDIYGQGTYYYTVEVYNRVNPALRVSITVSVEVYSTMFQRVFAYLSMGAVGSGVVFMFIASLLVFPIAVPIMWIRDLFQ